MTRHRLLIALVIIVMLIAGVTHLLTGSQQADTATLTVGQLWQNADRYEGKRVHTNGVVRIFSPGPDEYFVLEQAGQYRVGLRGRSNAEFEQLVGQPITVEGVVHFEAGFGYYIEIEQLDAS